MLPEIKVLYTRIDDSYPTLRQRTDFANDNNADLFISIHCDGFPDPKAYGTSSHVMGLDYSEKNLRVAQKENSVIYLEDIGGVRIEDDVVVTDNGYEVLNKTSKDFTVIS